MNSPGCEHANNLTIDKAKCTFCGVCAERCSLDNIRLMLSPCRQACPIGQNCQAYIQQIARGQTDRARMTILDTNPLPGVLSRICHHPCETACARTEVDGEPVAIRDLKRFAVDSLPPPGAEKPEQKWDQSVAIVGSGPAGLMAAWELRRSGYGVTLYEKSDRIGGNLASVIPEFRLPRGAVLKDLAWLEAWGVEIHLGIEMGLEISLEEIRSEHSAVCLALGAGKPVSLNIPGDEARNIYTAQEFLRAARCGSPPGVGRSVVVIGGGNSAVDAAQAARRLSAERVTVVCLERFEEMPAFSWAREEALEEGIAFDCGFGPVTFLTGGGRAKGIDCRLCLRVWEGKRFSPLLAPDIGKTILGDTFIVAVGDRPDAELLNRLGLTGPGQSGSTADPLTLTTSRQAVFAAGDMVTGSKSVVEAMAMGRQAAVSIDRYLKGDDLAYGRSYPGPYLSSFPIDLAAGSAARRQKPRRLSLEERHAGFDEIELGLNAEEALVESGRCLSCGAPAAWHDACWHCLPCEVACPEKALKVEIPYIIR